ncbi:Txe/YoeB family addiction module toxin [Mesorhizobium sp. RP14(2022)]|uniref:Putative mRNA interferase YoeB n=1 Tax=Mesorhizobium liriopis TaxID=2953882 RepID=A0ABT1C112_9HYPH|nr:Txe/YoeB family addiction module toxin [Mesorhizobium liriopis]MCO6048524.1 Txe/YoeB family addiction module toxin [Mesorhizobium liriopis]
MRIVYSSHAWDDYLHWQQTDGKMRDRINELVKDAMRHPFSGIGKPEPLKKGLSDWWSRRIDREHRLVYRVTGNGADQAIEIAACRFHYGD